LVFHAAKYGQNLHFPPSFTWLPLARLVRRAGGRLPANNFHKSWAMLPFLHFV